MTTAVSTPRTSIQQQVFMSSNRPSPGVHPPEPAMRNLEEENRALVTARIEKLARGDVIVPPCDRCRRLKTQCIKHLTACLGCTKKHARCIWKALTEEEITWLKGETGGGDDNDDRDEPPRAFSDPGPSSGPGPGPPHMEPGEPSRRDIDRGGGGGGGGDDGGSRAGSRIAIGSRHADDIWRKGPETSASASSSSARLESMDIDPRDVRPQAQAPEAEGGGGGGGGGGSSSYRDPSRLSHMASVASAAAAAAVADAAAIAAARGSPRQP